MNIHASIRFTGKLSMALAVVLGGLSANPAMAERISNPVVEFNGLDKITGRITSFDVYVGETVQFGALQVTPRVCYTRDETEASRVDSFVEVDEITLDRKIRRIFTGWMFADSPGLNAVEHPIYDVWMKGCKETSDVPPPKGAKAAVAAPVPDAAEIKPIEGAEQLQENFDPNSDIQIDGYDVNAVPDDAVDPNAIDSTIDTLDGSLNGGLEELPPPEEVPNLDISPQLQNAQPGSTGLY